MDADWVGGREDDEESPAGGVAPNNDEPDAELLSDGDDGDEPFFPIGFGVPPNKEDPVRGVPPRRDDPDTGDVESAVFA